MVFELLGSLDGHGDGSVTFVVSGRSRPTWLADQYGPVNAEFLALDFLSSASMSVLRKLSLPSMAFFISPHPASEPLLLVEDQINIAWRSLVRVSSTN